MLITTALALGVGSIVYLGYLSHQLKESRDSLVADLQRSESRNRLLDQKYKEQKAQAGRFQRESLLLKGQVRQAKMDVEKFEAENQRLILKNEQIEKQLTKNQAVCKNKMERLSELYAKLKTTYSELKEYHQKTTRRLRNSETKIKNMTSEMKTLNSELERMVAMNKRYKSHNVQLSKIARELVAQIEKNELGTTILVQEPLIQFERVELEAVLQEYLDKIDDEKIVH